jgi:mannonate dehydratase
VRRMMRQTWRWFGPEDRVSAIDARQAGAEALVCSLYHVPPGQVWTREEIEKRQAEARVTSDGRATGIEWEVVESLPVSEAIKTQGEGWRDDITNWRRSLENLADAGLETICYNFMPVLDWTRTDHRLALPHGGTAMSFDLVRFAAFDIYILAREGAWQDYPEAVVEKAQALVVTLSDAEKTELADAVIAGLAGSVESWTLETLRAQLGRYAGIDNTTLRRHHYDFLEEVVPTAERLGLRLCCHPDDPPFRLLGLPRVMSTEQDYADMIAAVDSPANGITLCTGSLGSRPDNDLPGFVERLGHKIFFAHLRNVIRYDQGVPTGFLESDHLGGQVDMVGVIGGLLDEQERRVAANRRDWQIPFRSDHGHELLNDVERGTRPGYPAIGRLKGLAELRGVMHALAH